MTAPISIQNIQWQALSHTNTLYQTIGASGSESRTGSAATPRLKEACAELESLFIYYMLKEMRSTIPKTELFSGGKAEEIYTSMMDVQVAKELSSNGGIGLSAVLLEQLGSESKRGDDPSKTYTKNKPMTERPPIPAGHIEGQE